MMVIPGQPLPDSAMHTAGSGCYSRNGQLYASLAGLVSKDGGVMSVRGKDDQLAIPEPNSIVIGTITRVNRMAASVRILTVDGKPSCQAEGQIRVQDIRQTGQESVRTFDCFRPNDVVRCKVISLGDARSYFLSTALNSLGVLFAVSSTTGVALEAVSWEEMVDENGVRESRKVAGPDF